MKINQIIIIFICVLFLSAFSSIGTAYGAVDEVLGISLGSAGLSQGMSKAQVVERYGEPSITSIVESSEWNEPREEWVYIAQYTVLPVNAGYLSEDLYLYFDGDNLTNVSKKPLGVNKPIEK